MPPRAAFKKTFQTLHSFPASEQSEHAVFIARFVAPFASRAILGVIQDNV